MRTSRAMLLGALAALILLGVTTGVRAQSASPLRSVLPQQTSGTQTAPAAAPKTGPTVIPPVEIAVEIEATRSRLRQIRLELAKDPATEAEEAQLNSLSEQIKALAPTIEAGETLLVDELEEQRRELRVLEARLDALSSGAAQRSQNLDRLREELRQLDQTWSATRDDAAQSDLPRSVRETIDSLLESVQAGVTQLRERRGAAYAFQGRVFSLKTELDAILAVVDAHFGKARVGLLRRDSDPLWQALRTVGAPGFAADFMNAWSRNTAAVVRYFAARRELLAVHFLLYLGLISLGFWVSRQSRTWLRDQDRQGNVLALTNRPFAAATLIAVFATYYLYPDAPLPVRRLPLVICILPLLRLLPELMPRGARPAFYSLAALFLVQRLEIVAISHGPIHRLALLGIAVLGLGVATLGFRAMERTGVSRRKRLVKAGMVLMVLALLGNVVGNVSLAVTLVRGSVGSAFWGVTLFAVVRVLEGFTGPLFRSPAARLSRALTAHRELIQRRYFAVLRFFARVAWVVITLSMFGILEVVAGGVGSALTHSWAVGQFQFSLGGILLFVGTIWLSVLAARFTAFLLEEDLLSRAELPKGLPATISMVVRYGVIFVGFVLALAVTGVQWSQLALVAGGLGVGIGLGLQSLVANAVAGFVLAFERPIRAGDVVEAGNTVGEVKRIGLRSSVIHTFEGAEIIVPNNELVTRQIVNWTLSDQVRRIEIPVGVAYGTDPRKVLRLLLDVTQNRPDILEKPEPVVLFRGFGDSSLNFVLRFHTGDFSNWPRVASDVTLLVSDALKAEGIEIPYPQRDIHIRSDSSK
jgi:potassium-dependent mechanosensitive channel